MSVIIEKISHALLEILSWFKSPILIPENNFELHEELRVPKVRSSVNAPPRKKIQTLSSLLDTIELTFDACKIKDDKLSWLDKPSRLALRRVGAHVPFANLENYEWFSELGAEIPQSCKQFPSVMMLSTNFKFSKEGTGKGKYPSFMFAFKHEKTPPHVQKIAGTLYQFGMAFEEKTLIWVYCWVVIKKDMSIEICKEHYVENINISPNGRSKGSFSKKIFDTAYMAKTYRKNEEDGIATVKLGFISLFNFWNQRQEKWNVSVAKGKNKVTFCIDKSLTKVFFSDREKKVKTPTGKAKTIVHYVKEHTRIVNNQPILIKEHLRGVNAFNWRGYQCLVAAPEFQDLTLNNFNIPAVFDDDEELQISKEFMPIEKVINVLSAKQDSNVYRGHA